MKAHVVSEQTRKRMQRTPARDNPLERSVRSALYADGYRYRIHYPIPGMARRTCDIAFPGLLIAVFLDGCFWHGCKQHSSLPKTNTEFWSIKIEKNVSRDQQTTAHLQSIGWRVLRFWSHDAVDTIVGQIEQVVAKAR